MDTSTNDMGCGDGPFANQFAIFNNLCSDIELDEKVAGSYSNWFWMFEWTLSVELSLLSTNHYLSYHEVQGNTMCLLTAVSLGSVATSKEGNVSLINNQ